ncbi:MAG: HlyC/CorC family transporter [Candidatus Hydrogenedentes bacterium]|nr:HlyC/CorC family transporter [Candidatus Hydrogenedentota bacterium]
MEDDPGGESPRISLKHMLLWGGRVAFAGSVAAVAYSTLASTVSASAMHESGAEPWYQILTPGILVLALVLGGFSAFFSASEVAFLSLNKVELRAMHASGRGLQFLAAHLMRRPGSLLTTILMGNTFVNIMLSIVFVKPLASVFQSTFQFHLPQALAIAVILTTALILFFCEILPKVFATTCPRLLAVSASVPMYVIDWIIMPFRYVAMLLVNFMFKITRLAEVKAAPFLTDEEFLSLVSDGEASGIIEEEERQMIKGILEFDAVTLEEILIPRPDIVGISETATIAEALETVRRYEFARMPVFLEDLDHISGILYAKDLLPVMEKGAMDDLVRSYMRPPHFIPATMSVGDFVKTAQKSRIHISIVVDEFGGTEGLVTLQDALREVVGDIGEEDDMDLPLCEEIAPREWIMAGNYPLDEFEELTGIESGDEEHTTVGGFLMTLSDKILEPGDELNFSRLHFYVKEVEGKRITQVLIKEMPEPATEEKD